MYMWYIYIYIPVSVVSNYDKLFYGYKTTLKNEKPVHCNSKKTELTLLRRNGFKKIKDLLKQ